MWTRISSLHSFSSTRMDLFSGGISVPRWSVSKGDRYAEFLVVKRGRRLGLFRDARNALGVDFFGAMVIGGDTVERRSK